MVNKDYHYCVQRRRAKIRVTKDVSARLLLIKPLTVEVRNVDTFQKFHGNLP